MKKFLFISFAVGRDLMAISARSCLTTRGNHDAFYKPKRRSGLLVGFIFLAFPLLAVHVALALTLSPIVLDFEVQPGSTQEKNIILFNEEQSAITVIPTVFEVVRTDDRGFPVIKRIDEVSKLAQIISFPKGTEYSLPPRQRVEVPVNIAVPEDSKQGGIYAVISWSSKGSGGDIAVSNQPGVNVAITIPGDSETKARIARFSLAGNTWWSFGQPATLEVSIANEGTRHVVPSGTVEIRSFFNRTIVRAPLTETARVLPGSTRTFNTLWKPLIACGIYRAFASVDVEGETLTAQTKFIFMSPLVAVGILVIIIAAVSLAVKRFRKKAQPS